MFLQLDFESEVPIYQQLVNAIVEGIATQALEPDEALPSVRAMAADIGINMHTVNKAYQILKNDGFLLIHRQKGVVVNPNLPTTDPPYIDKLEQNLRTIINEAICRELSQADFIKKCEAIYQNVISQRGEKN